MLHYLIHMQHRMTYVRKIKTIFYCKIVSLFLNVRVSQIMDLNICLFLLLRIYVLNEYLVMNVKMVTSSERLHPMSYNDNEFLKILFVLV